MFSKLVSGLPFSPALVGQLGFYAKRLRKEEATRRLGLIFTTLALVIQSLAMISPPEPANAASRSDLIYGGVSSIEELLKIYDNPSKDYKKIMDYNGITREEIASMKAYGLNSRSRGTGDGAWLSWGRVPQFGVRDGEVKHDIDGTVVYSRPLWKFDSTSWTKKNGSNYAAFIGTSAKMGTFAIVKSCGNLVTTKPTLPPPPAPKDIKVCRPGEGVITIKENEKKSTDLPPDSEVCNPPAPVIKDIQVCRPGTGIITIRETDKRSGDLPPDSDECKPKPKEISVCRPEVGVITIKENDKKSTDLPADSDECKPKPQPSPVAACSVLEVKRIERTKYRFVATSVAINGATVSKYTFVIKDAAGKVLEQKTVSSDKTTVETDTIELKNPGDYTAEVTVTTSVGEKKSPDCAKSFTVTEPDKCVVNPELLASDKDCQPCPGDESLWYKSPDCSEKISSEKTAINLTQNNAQAGSITANASDRIQFMLTTTNTGAIPATIEFKESMTDVLEYATVYDNGGGNLLKEENGTYLSWGDIELAPGEKVSRTFSVKVLDTIPLTARGISNPASYDCIMTNAYGNTININMNCEAPKAVEQVIEQLPSTGPGENIIFSGIVASIVVYFYARSRQLTKEIRLIRRDFNAGTI